MTDSLIPDGYEELLSEIKQQIGLARTRAVLAVNKELILLYWRIGREILDRGEREGWGAKVIQRLSRDLRMEFPQMKGLSRTNLQYMRAFAAAWRDSEIVQQVAGQLPWGHNMVLLDKFGDQEIRVWYARNAIEYGWSRNVLEFQIASGLHQRKGAALSNFSRTLPHPDSELVQQITKDPYDLEFIDSDAVREERALEKALLTDIQRFMLELGFGFSFVGSQYPIQVGGDEFFIDLLFFHIPLDRYVVIELKTTKFKPEYAGKLSFYVTAVDRQIKRERHASTVGLVLCVSKNETVVEYTLQDVNKPVGVAGIKTPDKHELTTEVPPQLAEQLPTVDELKTGLEQIVKKHKEINPPSDISLEK